MNAVAPSPCLPAAPAAGRTAALPPHRLVAQGQDHLQAGRATEAAACFTAALAVAPRHRRAVLGLAEALRLLGRAADGDAALANLLRLDPDFSDGHLALGRSARRQGDAAAALPCFHAAAACAPDRPQPWLAIAELARRRGESDAAIAAMRQAIARDPTALAPRCRLATDLARAGRAEEAAAEYRQVLDRDPGPEAALAVIVLALDLGDLARARAGLAALLARQPSLAAGWMQLGRLERMAGDPAASLAAYTEADRLRPDHPEILLHMAEEQLMLGRADRHDALAERVRALAPGHVGAIRLLARKAAITEDYEDALALCEQGLALSPDAPSLIGGAAEALSWLGRADEALARLADAATRLGPHPAIVARQLTLLRNLGRIDPALAMLTDVLAGSAHDTALMQAGLRLALRAGSLDQARQCIDRARPATLRDRTLHRVMQGEYAEHVGDPDAARLHYQAAFELDGRDAAVLMALVRVCILTLDIAGAVAFLARNRRMTAPMSRLKHRSANASQTLYGQILDDYRLDAATAATVAGVLPLAPADRLAPLAACVWAVPNSTLAASALLASLLACGRLQAAPPDAAPTCATPIPRTIVQFWDSGAPPPDIEVLMRSWPDANPGWAHRCFDTATAGAFLLQRYGPWAARAFARATQPAQKADLFRLGWLASQGGVYADADDRCRAPLDRLLPAHASLVLYREDLGTLGNNFIAAAPGHPVLAHAFMQAAQSLLRGDDDILWLSCGPGLLTRAFAAAVAAGTPTAASILAGTRVLTVRQLQSAVLIHCRAAYKQTGQAWQNTSFRSAADRRTGT